MNHNIKNLFSMWGKILPKIRGKTVDAIALLITYTIIYIAITIVHFALIKWLLGL